MPFRDVAQLVARLVWDQDVAGSNPVIPTTGNGKECGFERIPPRRRSSAGQSARFTSVRSWVRAPSSPPTQRDGNRRPFC